MAKHITESELRKIVKEYILEAIATPPLNCIIKKNRFLPNGTVFSYDKILNEGILKSYDTDFVIKHLCKYFNLTTDSNKLSKYQAEGIVFSEQDYDGKFDNVIVVIPISYRRIDELKQFMTACGFIESSKQKQVMHGLFQQIEFEKNVQEEITEVLSSYHYIYHLTPSVYVNKIMKNGLVPKSKNKLFNYNPRIYFLLDKTVINIQDVANMLYTIQLQDEDNIEAVKKYKNEYTLLKCKTSDLIGKVKFYLDKNLPNAVYTTENIPPQFIEIDTTGIKVS